MKNVVSQRALTVSIALSFALLSSVSFAQQHDAAPDSAVQVVTVYSQWNSQANSRASGEPSQPPIKIVNGGVKSAGDTCWKLSDSGELKTVPGDCYVLRSAEDAEHPPSH